MWQTSRSIYTQSPQTNWIFSLGWLLNQFECETRKVTILRGLSPCWSIAVQITCFSRHSVGSHATCDTVFPTCRCLYAHKICAAWCLCILVCKFKTNTSHWYVKVKSFFVSCFRGCRSALPCPFWADVIELSGDEKKGVGGWGWVRKV